jgi:putative flippase GtrA
MPVLASLRSRFAGLGPELFKFCLVGGTGAIIDIGGAYYLHFHAGVGPTLAKAISLTIATILTYLGSKFWTFRHRQSQHVLRETLIFAGLNIVGLLIALGVIAVTSYGLDMKGKLAYMAANVAGTALGTVFRYFTYKRFVFLEPVPVAVPVTVGPLQEQLDPVGYWD